VLIVFSGLDGAGKSTQIELLLNDLRTQGKQPIYLWVRGGYTPLFNAAKAAMRRLSGGRAVPPSGRSAARTEAMRQPWKRRLWLILAILDLMLVYGIQVRWWQWRGMPVVCDRYVGDTLVDFRLNFPQEPVEQWWLWRLLAFTAPAPDAAFLLLIPVAESLRRSQLKNEPFPDTAEVLAARLAHYEALAAQGYWQVLDGRSSIADLHRHIKDQIACLAKDKVYAD
jgi:thymidylate kinase